MKRLKWLPGYIRILSRHPSHNPLRNFIKTRPFRVCLRLGSITPWAKADIEINPVNAVENCSNKLTMKKLFSKAGVNSPAFIELFIDKKCVVYDMGRPESLGIERAVEKIGGYPILAKLSYRSRGQGMQKLENLSQLRSFLQANVYGQARQTRNPYYLEKFHNYTREYRLHVSELDRCFYTCRKMIRNDTAENMRWFRNNKNAVWILESNPAFNKPITWDSIVKQCNIARKALGMDITAFDVKVTRKGKFTILEANSAPSFGDQTLDMYQQEIIEIIQKRKKCAD